MRHKKYYLPPWAARAAASYIAGAGDMERQLLARERDIVLGTVNRAVSVTQEGRESLAYLPSGGGMPGDPTFDRATALVALWDSPCGRIYVTVNSCLRAAVAELPEAWLRRSIIGLIKHSCARGRNFCYEDEVISGISKSGFYRLRKRALWLIAVRTGLITEEE